ncbi:response regulator transcription factor [Salinibius halmophilus]|uniref:response regulator transcription factor n=1 Tax=Salinibius halmophilus TaxID=1853216 RepID=UPI000E667C73|nr:response regulator transcription factor [Salinibius halmophilus]
MRLLLIEDEARLAEHILNGLRNQGYAVDWSQDGEDGLFRACEYDYDLAIVDIGLPGIDGLEVIRELRKRERKVPALVLTARSHWRDKVEGLEAGADDYLGKPFVLDELLARVNALLRRSVGQASPTIEVGPLTIDTARKEVQVNGTVVALTSYEYNTLEYLVMHRSKVVSKTELTEHLYEQDYDRDSNTIEVFIRRLRKKLDPEGELQPIATLRGQGYRLALG